MGIIKLSQAQLRLIADTEVHVLPRVKAFMNFKKGLVNQNGYIYTSLPGPFCLKRVIRIFNLNLLYIF